MVRVNCEAIVHLTGAFLPSMIERGAGGVITVASTAGMQPLPYEAVYAASKAFALNFTDALNTELKGTGVRAMSVNPGPVPTEWQAVAGYEGGVPPKTVPGHIDAPAGRARIPARIRPRPPLDDPRFRDPQLHPPHEALATRRCSSASRSGCTARRPRPRPGAARARGARASP